MYPKCNWKLSQSVAPLQLFFFQNTIFKGTFYSIRIIMNQIFNNTTLVVLLNQMGLYYILHHIALTYFVVIMLGFKHI